jgi:hypothetical protein
VVQLRVGQSPPPPRGADAISGIVSRAHVRGGRMGRANNRIARDRVVANQIIGPRARANSFFIIIIFMAEYFI